MARFLDLPTLKADFLGPLRTSVDILGSSIDPGRNGVGESIETEFSGGGALSCTYEECKIFRPEHFRYVNWLGARMTGGFRYINVPIITDWWGLFPSKPKYPTPIVNTIFNPDGSLLAGETYSEATVYGTLTADAALNAGTLSVRVYGAARDIEEDESHWFSIYHNRNGDLSKGYRAYRNRDVVSMSKASSYTDYTLAIQPPLREATPSGARVEFARPLFAAKFKAGFTLPSISEAFYAIQQTIQFSEAF